VLVLKKVYRYIFDNYLKWSDLTLIGFLNRKLEFKLGKNIDKFNNINLDNVKLYFTKNTMTEGNVEKVLLVETMHTHATAMVHINIMRLLLSATSKTRSIGYSNFNEPAIRRLNSAFGINEYVTIYKVFNLKIVFLSILKTFKTLMSNSKFTTYKNISVLIDDVNIGEQIYDQFLRKELHGSYRRKTLKYFFYIYRGCYYYYSSKEILKKLNVTDIIVNNTVYTNGILIKACSNLNRNVNVWCTENSSFDQFSISRTKTSECILEIPNCRRFQDKYYMKLLNDFSQEQLDTTFDQSINRGLSWEEKIKATDLSKIEDFDVYNYDKNRKNVFIFSHAFNDDVRHANNIIYADYYIWLIETLNILSENNNINIFVKPHPSEFRYSYEENSENVIKEVLKKTPSAKIFYITNNINKNLLYSFADSIVTVCGSIGLEAPCYGVPVITAARGTYYEAETTINSENIREYENNLTNIHLINSISIENISKAKIVYIFASILRYVDFGFDLNKELTNDVERFRLVNENFKDFKKIKDTQLYKLYLEMINNKFDEFINVDVIKNEL